MMKHAVVASGHEKTTEAAVHALEAGGNAFDGVVAALWAASVVEPALASLGGGGFLLARTAERGIEALDFFAQTPRRKRPPAAIDFHPIDADFGTATQEFHIGMGSVATPGTIPGLFRIHEKFGRLPMTELAGPAIELARGGFRTTAFQAYVLEVLEPIYRAHADTFKEYESPDVGGRLRREGDRGSHPDLAATIEALARQGERLYREGEIGQRIVGMTETDGGHLTFADLAAYRVEERHPLRTTYRDHRIYINPPPSCGGILIGFALQLLAGMAPGKLDYGSFSHLAMLAHVMEATSKARADSGINEKGAEAVSHVFADREFCALYARDVQGRHASLRGTTHISIIDKDGNAAAATVSNGEGCGRLVPGTGIMLNNMLGEEDLHPAGFSAWRGNERISSMMAPTIVLGPEGRVIAMGSGGSNRLRTAILQVLGNLIDFGMGPQEAVSSPRIHFERGLLNLEGGIDGEVADQLAWEFPRHEHWPERNLFFGGVHMACSDGTGAADERRDGHWRRIAA